ncbi:MAG: YdeI/OmpD-associated family protein [Umezawaea sp.]
MLQELAHGEKLDGADVIVFADTEQWTSWLADNHELTVGVWVKIAKKGSGKKSITITEALDGALCHGWIDSQRRSYDQAYYLQRYSPRRAKGSWSKVNVDKVEALIAACRMREPGYAAIDAAKADGRWDAAYLSQRVATVPDDLAAELAACEPARTAFEALDRTHQYALLLRLMKAKTPATRAVQLQQIVASLTAAG